MLLAANRVTFARKIARNVFVARNQFTWATRRPWNDVAGDTTTFGVVTAAAARRALGVQPNLLLPDLGSARPLVMPSCTSGRWRYLSAFAGGGRGRGGPDASQLEVGGGG